MAARFRLKDPEEARRLREKVCAQNKVPGVKPITAWRIESGQPCYRENADAYYIALQTKLPSARIFEVAEDEDYYGWGRIEDAARRVGDYLFNQFKATAVISYAGPSAIFANLVMAMRPGGTLLSTPVYLALHMELKTFMKIRVRHPDFVILKEGEDQDKKDQCVVLFPKALETDDPEHKYKIAIIDDALVTGRPMRLLKGHLIETIKYTPDRIKIGCCVCHKMILARHDETTPDERAVGFKTNIDPIEESIRFPWGNAVFFPPRKR